MKDEPLLFELMTSLIEVLVSLFKFLVLVGDLLILLLDAIDEHSLCLFLHFNFALQIC